jgi:hypothetical protein
VWADLKKTSFIIAALSGVMAIEMAIDKASYMTKDNTTDKARQKQSQ